MEASFTTILISAKLGGVAGSIFPVLKNAIGFVVLECDAKIEKLGISQQRSRLGLKKEVTNHSHEISELVDQGQDLFRRYREGESFDDFRARLLKT